MLLLLLLVLKCRWPGLCALRRSLPFTAAGMPQDAAAWEPLKDLQLCWATQFL